MIKMTLSFGMLLTCFTHQCDRELNDLFVVAMPVACALRLPIEANLIPFLQQSSQNKGLDLHLVAASRLNAQPRFDTYRG
jgi:hypothetical protein